MPSEEPALSKVEGNLLFLQSPPISINSLLSLQFPFCRFNF